MKQQFDNNVAEKKKKKKRCNSSFAAGAVENVTEKCADGAAP